MTIALHQVTMPSLLQRLQAIEPPLLAKGDFLEFTATDRIGGGRPCSAADCPRSRLACGLCITHLERRKLAQRTDSGEDLGPTGPDRVLLSGLPEQVRWELAYGLRSATESSTLTASLKAIKRIVAVLKAGDAESLLAVDELNWTGSGAQPKRLRGELVPFMIDRLDALLGTDSQENEFARDSWRLRRLGITGDGEGWIFDFTPIAQPWLREAIKRFLRWRIATGHSVSGMHRDVITLTRLSQALTEVVGPHAGIEDFTRSAIDRLLSLLVEEGLSANGRSMALTSVRMFFTLIRQHDWIPGLSARTALYPDDMPRRTALPPRALSEFVMTQLENADSLALLPDDRYRLLIIILMQTGLRQKDARFLPLDCLSWDAEQAPYLRYFNHKMNREALVPVGPEVAAAIVEQRRRMNDRYPEVKYLFAASSREHQAPVAPPTANVLRGVFTTWLAACGVHDESGRLVHVTPHQFRHTLGTRLINNDVPQEVVRQLLDHSSSEMTAHYARLHDTTVRKHWERARKVNIEGRPVTMYDDSPLADAAWMQYHLGRATMALPNGYCGLPLQQRCPHANACLTCPVFITTPDFLEQLTHTQQVLEGARSRKQLRLVEINQRISDNLTTIITALEAEDPDAR